MTQQRPETPGRFDRRTFIAGTATAGLLAACGGTASSEPEPEFELIQRFPVGALVPGDVRLPFSLSKDAAFLIDGPDSLEAQIVDIDGNSIGERISAVRRDVNPFPYYSFTTRLDTPGVYGIVVDGGPSTGANFQVLDAGSVAIPSSGQALPAFDTPTTQVPGGVDPICTREPACDFHSVTLTEAMATGSPVVYFVGTPALCETQSCTPALEALVELQPEFSSAVFVHAEVYTDTTGVELAPAVQELSLAFEPTVFLVDADGMIVERLDGLWDVSEMRERLAAFTAA